MIEAGKFQNFLSQVTESLDGDWLVIGGSLIAILIPGARVTQDIDICSIDEMNNEKRLALMEIAHNLQMPIESINPAADFFLRQIPDWKKSIILLSHGKSGRLYRPSFELYLALKVKRLSDSDYSDIQQYLNWTLLNDGTINFKLVNKIVTEEQLATHSIEKDKKLKSLQSYFSSKLSHL